MTSAGLFTAAMPCAIVNVLPDPVTPSSTCERSPRRSPSTSCAMAVGWSPRSSKSVSRVKRSEVDDIDEQVRSPDATTYGRVPTRQRGLPRSDRRLPVSADLLGRVVAGPRAHFDVLQIGPRHLDFHLAETAVGRSVRRHIADRVARQQLVEDLCVDGVNLLGGAWKKRIAAGLARDLGDLH